MNRFHRTNRIHAAALAAILTVTAATAALAAGPVSLEAQAAGTTYQVNPTKEMAGTAAAAGQHAQSEAAAQTITATATALSGEAADSIEATLDYLIENEDWSLISNFTEDMLYINSMAGGIEPLSSYQITFASTDETALTETGQAMVVIPLREVMDGRTLRAGESVQGFLYNNADGLFYATETVILGDQLVYYAPYFAANTDNRVTFFVSRGDWTVSDTTYDYLAIGNSITLHPRRDFWPDAMGMGASSIDKDYVHIVERGLTRTQANVNTAALNYSIWEILWTDRASTLILLDNYLSEDLDLVTVMLGENAIKNRGTFVTDYPALIQYIKEKAPNATVVLVGTYWQDDEIETIKMQTAATYGCLYVSLAEIQNSTRYQFGNGSAADANGVRHYSDNPGTAIHPNDAAMSYIANGILSVLQPVSNEGEIAQSSQEVLDNATQESN